MFAKLVTALVVLFVVTASHAETTRVPTPTPAPSPTPRVNPFSGNAKIERAYTDSRGGTIVIFRPQATFGDNVTFYCFDGRCDQLQQTTRMRLGDAFGVGFTSRDGAAGSLLADSKKGQYTLTCTHADAPNTSGLKPLALVRQTELERRINGGGFVLRELPAENVVHPVGSAPASPCPLPKAGTQDSSKPASGTRSAQ